MKRSNQDSSVQDSSVAVVNGKPDEGHKGKNNGSAHVAGAEAADLSVILASLQTMREGDFSVRLPGSWTGLAGKIADTFNSIVAANQQMA